MSKKDIYKIVPWFAVILCGFALAVVGRLIAEQHGISAGSSNLIFILILATVILAYLLFNVVWETAFEKLFGKKATPKPKNHIELPEDSELRGKVESFCQYSGEVLGGYITDEEMELLHGYIAQYATGDMENITQKIEMSGLDTFEMCHYGWNIWNHFRVVQQPETAQWLINVFSALEGANPNTLYKKFTHNERFTYKIDRRDDIK